jgi:hypothetical protein
VIDIVSMMRDEYCNTVSDDCRDYWVINCVIMLLFASGYNFLDAQI